jgi:hypothetical protein
MCIFYIHERSAFLYYWELDFAMRPPNKPSPTSNRLVCNINSYNRISHTDWVLEFYDWRSSGSWAATPGGIRLRL